ncbi:MAG: magnesium transporter [Candidatus Babeliales bacterium]|jgi:magnesium transporter
MLTLKKILLQIENNIESIIKEDTILGKDLWQILLQQHPADIALIINNIDNQSQIALFKKMPKDLAFNVFEKIQEPIQAFILANLDHDDIAYILTEIPVSALTDLFEHISDEELEKYLKLLQVKQRNKLISLRSFAPESAGARMQTDVLTLQENFTVKRSIEVLQRLTPKQSVDNVFYVTDKNNVIVGYLTIDKLVLNKPETLLSQIMDEAEFLVYVDEDQEDVANQMKHYNLICAPVIDKEKHFLGIITAEDVFEIMTEEESEDVYKMSGQAPMEHSYFATPTWQLVRQRIPWLIGLLLLQSFSSMILLQYNSMISSYAIITLFLTMLIGTGGNAGNQSATLVIRGLTTKEITRQNGIKMLVREMGISLILASIIVLVGFTRVFYTSHDIVSTIAITLSLFLIIVTSITLGTLIPLVLERFNLDPAHSAAPFLTTLMDILGVLIYCVVCSRILG